MNKKLKIGIVGGTGYTGVELLRILVQHPNAELAAITSRQEEGIAVAKHFPSLRGHVDLAFSDPAKANLAGCHAVSYVVSRSPGDDGGGCREDREPARHPATESRACALRGSVHRPSTRLLGTGVSEGAVELGARPVGVVVTVAVARVTDL